MTFLHSWMLWGLLAAALPVVIHLLNRLRFRSVKWAAMMFLIQAARSSTRNSRLRQYLILACRTLAVLAFALALCRPLSGGWIGSLLAGAPDTVIVILDRSASMEAVDARVQKSKRERALVLLAGVAKETVAGSRFVLIDSALRTPQEIAGPAALPALPLAGATDTAADMPGLFRAAAEYMIKNKTGRTEIWVASDLPASNWLPERREWGTVAAQLAALQRVKIRVLAMPELPRRNLSVTLREAPVRRVGDKFRIDLALEFNQGSPDAANVPATLTLDGVRSPLDVALTGSRLELTKKIEIPADRLAAGGWGKVEIPADENSRDNACYFVYGSQASLRALVTAADEKPGDFLRLAIAPSPALGRVCDRLSPAAAPNADYQKLAFVVWQGAAPAGAAAEKLRRFAEAGGVVLFLPPAGVASAVSAPAPDALLGWGGAESAEAAKPVRVALWDDLDGPLAKSASGRSLPVARLEAVRRCVFVAGAELSGAAGDSGWHALATYVDGKPFLLRRSLGNGKMYAVTTLPSADWSNLGEGMVLVPMIQRMLEQGGQRLGSAEIATCGEWTPLTDGEVWRPSAEAVGGKNYRTQAGVYGCGSRLVALNRPQAEDLPDTMAKERLPKLFGSVPVTITESLAAESGTDLQSELWPLFVLLALLFLIAEAALLLGEHIPRQPAETKKI